MAAPIEVASVDVPVRIGAFVVVAKVGTAG